MREVDNPIYRKKNKKKEAKTMPAGRTLHAGRNRAGRAVGVPPYRAGGRAAARGRVNYRNLPHLGQSFQVSTTSGIFR